MSEPISMVEAVNAVNQAAAGNAIMAQQAAQPVADPAAVGQFQELMQAGTVQDVPFARQVAGVWNAAQDNYQELLHRITSLNELAMLKGPSMAELTALQYDVASLSFQQEVVTNIAKKSSDAIQTLIKNG